MCNLFASTMPVDAMRSLFDVAPDHDALGNAEPRPAIFPRGDAAMVAIGRDGARHLRLAHWGFVLPRTSSRTSLPIQPKAVTNARDDKLRGSPFWRTSFERRRCLIPATSFCEPKGRDPATYHWFGLAGEGQRPPFAFAGVWRVFRGPYGGEDRELVTSSIVTTGPNALVARIHPDRMPVILDPGDYGTWLTGSPDAAAALLCSFPDGRMVEHQSGRDLKSDRGGLDPG